MRLFNASTIIKEGRIAQGLSQKKLAEGICARETITRLEKGTHKPNWFVMKNLLIRLGINPDDYSDVATEPDAYMLKTVSECSELIRTLNFEGLKTKIEEFEMNRNAYGDTTDDTFNRVLLRMKAYLHAQGKYKDTALSIQYIMEYIKQVRPDFEIDNIPEYFLSADEAKDINLLAILYRDTEGVSKALEIWQKLRENYEKEHQIAVNSDITYRELRFNISLALKYAERFEECLEMAEAGIELSKAYCDMRTYVAYLHQKAWCLMKLEHPKEGEEVFKNVLRFAYVLDGWAQINFQTIKQEYKDVFGGTLDLSIPW